MIQYDRLYNDPKPTSDDDPAIPGPLSRLDTTKLRYVEYFGTNIVPFGASSGITFQPINSPVVGPPDFWVIWFMPSDQGGALTVQEEGQGSFLLMTGFLTAPPTAGIGAPAHKFIVPARSRQITFTNQSAVGMSSGANAYVQAAAVWGYDPKDVL